MWLVRQVEVKDGMEVELRRLQGRAAGRGRIRDAAS